MKIKFLAIIAGFLFMSIAISSCLDSDDATMELSSDATVHAFGLDTIYGKHYQFTIDQLNRVIYNRDSLPIGADTIIDKILIDTFSVSGWITAGINDTLFNKADSVDLRGAVNNEGMKFKVHAPDGSTHREYTLKINKHKLDPDLLVWRNMTVPTSSPLTGALKAVILNDALWVYTNSTTAYKTSTKAGEFGWQTVQTTFPANAKPHTIVNFKKRLSPQKPDSEVNQALYVVTTNNEVYSSTDGIAWTQVTTLGSNIENLIASFTDVLTGITANGFYTSKDGVNWVKDSKNETLTAATPIPDNFPKENIYATNFTNTNNVNQVMAVGMPKANKQTFPWFSLNGSEWVDLFTTAYDTYCPALNNPVCMHYGGMFYIFGGKESEKLNAIYSSVAGISWYKTEKKFLLPKEFEDITAPYSIVVDNLNYIWVIFGGKNMENTVWRGRLNKLGFIQ